MGDGAQSFVQSALQALGFAGRGKPMADKLAPVSDLAKAIADLARDVNPGNPAASAPFIASVALRDALKLLGEAPDE